MMMLHFLALPPSLLPSPSPSSISASPSHTLPLPRSPPRYVEEEESVRRQLSRGRAAILHNQKVLDSGFGELQEVRPTDLW